MHDAKSVECFAKCIAFQHEDNLFDCILLLVSATLNKFVTCYELTNRMSICSFVRPSTLPAICHSLTSETILQSLYVLVTS